MVYFRLSADEFPIVDVTGLYLDIPVIEFANSIKADFDIDYMLIHMLKKR
ncbi:hypothetical protein [Fredinandcohnia sp. 179-A 10B2 NHS]